MEMLKRFIQEEEGQAMAEYGLILALIAVVVAGVAVTLGEQIKDAFNVIVEALKGNVESDG
ncbi:Flp family type IVb pilin [Halobacillus seohaensis]|uniref:Flp family type IVb pilin n=1 Tax=Halobacillus seohaensis TaxID=447421 RepID=A0ABW2ER14_9BACI